MSDGHNEDVVSVTSVEINNEDENEQITVQSVAEAEPDSDDSSERTDVEIEGSSSSDSDHWIDPKKYQAPPAEYWHIQKLAGNKTAVEIALACLLDHDLENEFNRVAIRDIGGLEVLINLLETNHYNSKYRALDILCIISKHKKICMDITNLGIIPIVVRLLTNSSLSIQTRSAYMISIISELKRTRDEVYKIGGIEMLVHNVDIDKNILMSPKETLSPDRQDLVALCTSSAKALFSLSKSKKVKERMIEKGIIKLIRVLIGSVHEDIVLYTMGFFQNCATESKCQMAIETEDIIGGILYNLNSANVQLKMLCAQAIFKSCDKEGPRRLIYEHKGCQLLVNLLKDSNIEKDVDLLISITGAIWKCSYYEKNLNEFHALETTKVLVRFVRHEDEEVLVNVVGCLMELAKIPQNRDTIQRDGALRKIVTFLKYANNALLQNVTTVLGYCACNKECMRELEDLDAIRFIWSLLKNRNADVQASAAFALVSCIEFAEDSGEMVRSFVGGIELLVRRLRSRDETVVAAVCAVITKIAKDKENLAVISDHGVMAHLSKHIKTENILLRQHLASAIAACCWWKNNCHLFGQLGICGAIVNYIKTDVEEAKTTAAEAMYALSFDPINCISLHRNGAVPYLLESIESQNANLQMAAAGCLSNIRRLVLKADKIKYGVQQRYKVNDSVVDAPSKGYQILGTDETSSVAKLCDALTKPKT